jgi:hypothetical protein
MHKQVPIFLSSHRDRSATTERIVPIYDTIRLVAYHISREKGTIAEPPQPAYVLESDFFQVTSIIE